MSACGLEAGSEPVSWMAEVCMCSRCFGEIVGVGWTSTEVTKSSCGGLWAVLVFKAHNPHKFKMDVSDVVGADRPDYLARFMAIHPPGKRVEVHIYASERTD